MGLSGCLLNEKSQRLQASKYIAQHMNISRLAEMPLSGGLCRWSPGARRFPGLNVSKCQDPVFGSQVSLFVLQYFFLECTYSQRNTPPVPLILSHWMHYSQLGTQLWFWVHHGQLFDALSQHVLLLPDLCAVDEQSVTNLCWAFAAAAQVTKPWCNVHTAWGFHPTSQGRAWWDDIMLALNLQRWKVQADVSYFSSFRTANL